DLFVLTIISIHFKAMGAILFLHSHSNIFCIKNKTNSIMIKYNPAHNKKMSCIPGLFSIPVTCAIYNLHLQITFIDTIHQKSYRCYAESNNQHIYKP
ncbi:hypothetical protein VIGAN_01357200, partial [Vigna angularis var. angularis]